MIIPGSESQAFAAALADASDESLGRVEYEDFADGESVVRVPDEIDRAVVVASTLSDHAHVELLQLQDAAREAGADEVLTVLPYMGYARQDEAFRTGEPVSSRAMARAISSGTDRVLTVNPHEDSVCDFFDVPAEPVDAAGVLADPLPATLDEPLFLSPDEGAVDIATTVRDAYGRGTVDYFEKERDYDTGAVDISPSDATVADRDVVVADDIIATGSTMSEAVGVLNDRGAGRVFVSCVHPMLASNAQTKLASAGVERVYGTDTIERAVSDVSAASAVAERL
ncbi:MULTISPECIES: ribose-phosphate diphosphokinase [Halomicrobium]|uniref:Ribose-phosphate pyrophosphokinase n=2 Tax=Halomicrobium mukohataei TaxID=57705 RepID=C7P0Q8_HALMD|nr:MULTISPECIES: ribose-phosphate diphosphokinase [Halomicrobium]ACV47040.1 ribose-phosphate pyrophosphokinase [Halomicrobium mukohataei DSM 12286]QCD65530.1 ribose-phosphate diphosphokinase [Halomicrobium mukohataei]QFR20336.1 ribose-phosphate diphosphokinase [Halomicrobium sp. ZPS1]